MSKPQREILKLNKVDENDKTVVTLEGEKKVEEGKSSEAEIKLKGFEVEEEAKYKDSDFTIKANDFGMWDFKLKRGGKVPSKISSSYTSEPAARQALEAFLATQ
jgi:hypothetical protein